MQNISTIPEFAAFLRENFDLTQEEENLTQKYFEKQDIKKNEILLNIGEKCNKLYFVAKGLLRTFHLNKNGSEFTRLMVPEGKFCTILISFQEKISSPATIQALENGLLFSISLDNFQEFISRSTNAKNVYTKILEDYQNFQISRLEFLTTLTPQEKVEQFLAENLELEKRISDRVISTYLQITPETYSRCKKKITS
ncbi:cAMP-binding domain of CRP or a regulatory subunit of cAMP-dependent protein kinases [Kaistella chaponensis]|jgi:CRP-like cAMP-binding protein|uniref:cAMP-binding domain of CRP or a regulatory subunit of cAMP-dependent protein kinases n=1 Tax=Kaistella chaponensis TaxID=713588 RepID=A0A1N7JAP9_9FLAO|nr:Crp/Fnr family transcriptional regulator [Kaistella chaponensis]SIS46370.1 cAMP-binding domain of CRP or a regulatory subunit of cAMP-dependent protein kinases [Kaistella chaponensis]